MSEKNQINNGPPLKTQQNTNVSTEIPSIDKPIFVNQFELRKLQKQDVINTNEDYDTELGVNETNIPVKNETFNDAIDICDESPIPPIKDVINNAQQTQKQEKSIFVQDENNPIPIKSDYQGKIPIKDISETYDSDDTESNMLSTENNTNNISPDDLDEDPDTKEYISKREILRRENTKNNNSLAIASYSYTPKEKREKKEKIENFFITGLLCALGITFIVLLFAYLGSHINSISIPQSLSAEEKAILNEEYEFIIQIKDHLLNINKLVAEEKKIINNYVSDVIPREQAISELNTILSQKEAIYNEYILITPQNQEVLETKILSDKIIKNTIEYTKNSISSIEEYISKSLLVTNFNDHVEINNSNIYMYNQYVISTFKKRGITVTYDGVNFAIDTTTFTK